ncbi:hypothetical protein [Streptomyces jumonjinensis]|uniref:hypothetical protein n=1 Tax=Streptomyces jumonjinensis TaxID=1945 RepID=UPI00379A93BF
MSNADAVGEWLLSIAGTAGVAIGAFTVLFGWLRRDPIRIVAGILIAGISGLAYAGAIPDAVRGIFTGDTDPAVWMDVAMVGSVAVIAVTGTAGIIRDRRRRSEPVTASGPRPRGLPPQPRPSDRDRRSAIEAAHDEIREVYGAYVADVLSVLDRPALDDVTVPATEAFLRAMAAADDHRRGEDLIAYREAVTTLRTAWRAADDHARKAGVGHLPAEEAAAVTKARSLLELALDGRGADHERQAAYAKARQLLDGVLVIPRQALAAIEHQVQPALTKAGPTEVRKDSHHGPSDPPTPHQHE